MIGEAFKITAVGVGQSLILGLIGYILIRREFLGHEGLTALSRLVIEVTLPLLMFCRIVRDFDALKFPQWWLFPFLSLIMTCAGLGLGFLCSGFTDKLRHKLQFTSLIAFQNAGYLPLVLVAAMLPPAQLDVMFIYLFLFMLGFNMTMFSLGVYMLTFQRASKFDWLSLFSPPVVATLAGLAAVFLNIGRFIPDFVLKPLQMTGDCTVPLATLVVGGNIAALQSKRVYKRGMALMIFAKLVVMPVVGLWVVYALKLPFLIGFLIVLELAMPPATNLSVVMRQYRLEDDMVSQGVFYGHVASLVTIPLFLSVYFMLTMVK